MGFLSIIEDKEIYSFRLNDEQWDRLRSKYKDLNIKMPCCNTRAIPKKNKLGTQFFAHHPSSACGFSSGESTEHQFCKYLIAKTLSKLGWTVFLEHRGQTPQGEIWIADIYAEKDSAKIAIEIQWSPQSLEETKRRQQKYIDSNVRAVWFLRTTMKNKRDVLDYQSYELPAFSISLEKESRNMIASGVFNDWDSADLVDVELTAFMTHLLNKGIQYSLKAKSLRRCNVSLNKVSCWRCKKITNVIMDFNYYIQHEAKMTKVHRLDLEEIPQPHLAAINTSSFRNKYQFGAIKKRFSKTRQESYISNGCYHCDALQGAFFAATERDAENLQQSEFISVVLEDNMTEDGSWYFLM